MNDTQIPDGQEGVRNEKNINDVIKYAVFIMVATLLSQIISVEFVRGIIELVLSLGSFWAYQRSRSDMVQKVTIIAFFVLLFMGLYDISSAFGMI